MGVGGRHDRRRGVDLEHGENWLADYQAEGTWCERAWLLGPDTSMARLGTLPPDFISLMSAPSCLSFVRPDRLHESSVSQSNLIAMTVHRRGLEDHTLNKQCRR